MPPCIAHVDHLPPEGATYALELTPEAVSALLSEGGLTGVPDGRPLSARLRVVPGGTDVFVLGDLSGAAVATCGRCLESFEVPVRGDFHLTYVAAAEPGQSGEKELHREELDLEVLRDGMIDLDALVAEQLLLLVPTHPVCSETCRGLCPVCGANRNQEACACGETAGDPRFALLAGLRRGVTPPVK